MNTVLLVGTADTKSDEIAFLREQVLALGAMRGRLHAAAGHRQRR